MSSAPWQPPTLGDELEARAMDRARHEEARLRRHEPTRIAFRQVHGRSIGREDPEWDADAEPAPPVTVQRERCPGVPGRSCGRLVWPRILRDVRAVALARPELVGAITTHICDSCEWWLKASGRVDQLEWLELRGAPDAMLDHAEAKLAADPYAVGRPAHLRPPAELADRNPEAPEVLAAIAAQIPAARAARLARRGGRAVDSPVPGP